MSGDDTDSRWPDGVTARSPGAGTASDRVPLATEDEEELSLVRRARGRDREAFGLLYDRYVVRVYRFTRAWGGVDPHQAEDLTAQVFLRAWSGLVNLRDERVFVGWLYRIARNVILNHARSAQTVGLDQAQLVASGRNTDPEAVLDQESDAAAVREALDRLPEAQRTVLVLRFMEGLSHREVGKILGKSEAAVRVAQFRALARLKELLVEACVV